MRDKKIYSSIIRGLNEAIDYEKGKSVAGLKKNKIIIAPIPHYNSSRVKEIRNKLHLSQSTFAGIIGVSIKTVEAWESGRNVPQGPAQRILSLMEKDNNILKKYKIIVG